MDAPRPTTPALSPNTGCLLGVDPGLQRTGYAILVPTASGEPQLVEAGVIRLPRSMPLAERLLELDRSLTELTQGFRPVAMACEELYSHYRHPRTAILMGHARGVVLVCAARAGLPVIPISATRAKKLLTGRGHAAKPQMQRAAAALLRLTTLPEPHDVADAIAIALAGLRLRHADALLAAERGT